MSRRHESLATLGLVAIALVIVTACGGSQPAGSVTGATPEPTLDAATPAAASSAATPPASSSPAAANPLTGEWLGVQRCEIFVEVLTAAGYPETIPETVVGNGLIPNVTDPAKLADPANPCEGAVEYPHSHSFTADGRFASWDGTHRQVDDGFYAIVDEDTLTIGSATFTYAIDGDQLMLAPDMEPNVSDRDPAIDWQWAATVALDGHPWTRVEP